MVNMKIDHFVVGPVQTNCYFVTNIKTKEMIIIDPGACAKQLAKKVDESGAKPVAIIIVGALRGKKAKQEEVKAEVTSTLYNPIQPKLDVQLLTPNPYSRPQKALEKVNGIVVHYTANPGTSARQNRDYFNGLAETKKTKASSHFVIGLEGEIVQCIPCNEISYASNNRNSDTISIECCIEDETGKFNDSTYQSLIELTTWLMGRYDLSADDVIRHYDVTGKKCPLYFVEHEDAWEQFHRDLDTYIEENGVPKEEASQN